MTKIPEMVLTVMKHSPNLQRIEIPPFQLYNLDNDILRAINKRKVSVVIKAHKVKNWYLKQPDTITAISDMVLRLPPRLTPLANQTTEQDSNQKFLFWQFIHSCLSEYEIENVRLYSLPITDGEEELARDYVKEWFDVFNGCCAARVLRADINLAYE